MSNKNGLANPVTDRGVFELGLTKREYAAIQIMAGFGAAPETGSTEPETLAKSAVYWADALFKELGK